MKYIENFYNLNYTDSSWVSIVDLSKTSIDYLWDQTNAAISLSKDVDINHKSNLAGNISSSLILKDGGNMFVDNILPEVFNTNRDFYSSKMDKKLLNFSMTGFWVNFQKKFEFNPIHSHDGDFSFVIWMNVPYYWENEIKSEIIRESNTHNAVGNFMFVYPEDNKIRCSHITMSPEMNGKMAIFPSYLTHMVYPFYTSDNVRVSISGNVFFGI
jgi:hypothetical protein